MRKQYITDPNILAKLNGENIAPQKMLLQQNLNTVGKKYITDPKILSKLNPSNENSFGTGLENTGKSIFAGLGQGLQSLARSGETPAGVVGPDISAQMKQDASSIENYDLAKNMGIPNTGWQNLVQGTFKETPAIAASIASGGASSLPEAASLMATQGAFGAQLHPENPISNALIGAGTQGAGDLLSGAYKSSAAGAVKQSIGRLVPYANKLLSAAQDGYDVLENMGKKLLVDKPDINPSSAFGNIFNPEDAVNYLANVKNKAALLSKNLGMNKEINSLSQPDYKSLVYKNIDPNVLNAFQNTKEFKNGWAQTKFNEFAANPTAENAGITLRALSSARTGNFDKDQILSTLRDQIKDNIVSPGVAKFASPDQADKYSLADINYREFKKLFGNSQELENIARGNVNPATLKPQEYFNILKNAKESGAFNPDKFSAPGTTTIPMQEYNMMQNKLITPSLHQEFINMISPLTKFLERTSPLAKTIMFGSQGNNQ